MSNDDKITPLHEICDENERERLEERAKEHMLRGIYEADPKEKVISTNLGEYAQPLFDDDPFESNIADEEDLFEVATSDGCATSEDTINAPSHYTKGGIEVLDILKAKFGNEAVYWFAMCNVVKYTLRFNEKGGTEDLKKARFYLDFAIELKEEK